MPVYLLMNVFDRIGFLDYKNKTTKMTKKPIYKNPMWILAFIAAFAVLWFGGLNAYFAGIAYPQPEAEDITPRIDIDKYDKPRAGTAATITLATYDKMSDSLTAISGFPLWISRNGGTPTSTTTASTYTAASVGDKITVWGGNATSHMDSPVTFEVVGAAFPVDLDGYTRQTEGTSTITVTCYDNENNELGAYTNTTGGTDATDADYNISIGADGTETFTCKIRNAGANKGIILGGLCLGYDNNATTFRLLSEGDKKNIPEEYLVGGAWSPLTIPKHVASVKTTVGSHSYKACYSRDKPLVIPEWGYVYLNFEAGCTSDCVNTDTQASQNVLMFVIKDHGWALGEDGFPYAGIADRTINEADVGVDETETSPQGKDTGTVIIAY